MFEVGKSYKTVGGWEAKIIWQSTKECSKLLYSNLAYELPVEMVTYVAIHQPYTNLEVLVIHRKDGTCYSHFSVNAPPMFNVPHPACLTYVEIV